MALIDNLKASLANWAIKSAGLPVMSTTGQRYQAPDRRAFEQQAKAYLNQVVLACIATRATTLNEPPLVAVNPETKQPIMQHPLTRLFRRPNRHMSQSMFWQYVSTYIDIGGNCYIHKVRNVYGQVIELRPYHSGHIVPISETGQWVDFYKYQYEGVEKEIDPRDIIHIRSYYIDPLNPILGISPIRAAGINIDTYNELMATLYSYLRNNGVPSGVLSVQQTINAQQAESLKEQFQSNTTGANRGKPVVLPSGMSYTQMGLDVSKMEASSQFKQYETAICSIYRISSAVVMTASAIDSKYSNMQTAFQEYTTLTRVPTWNTWEDQCELSFADEYPEVDLEFDTSNVGALQADVTMQSSVVSQFTSNLITVNEARQKLGYGSLDENGDRYSYDLTAPAPTLGFGSSDASESVSVPQEAIAGVKWKAPKLPTSGKIDQSADVKAEAFWKGMDKTVREFADRLEGPTEELIAQVGDVLIGDVRKQGGKSLSVKANDPRLALLIERYMKATGKWREQLLQEITKLAVIEVGGDMASVQSYLDRILAKTTNDMAAKIGDSVGSIRDDVQATVTSMSGATAEDIEEELKKKFETMPASKAATIARTTARASSSTISLSTWSSLNEDETDPDEEVVKVWTTRRDGKVRETHKAMDGEWVTMGSSFSNGSFGPSVGGTAGEAVNCRCVMRPVRRKNLGSQARKPGRTD